MGLADDHYAFVGATSRGRLRLPRVLVTPHLMGRTLGPVGARHRQREVVELALRLLVEPPGPETRWQFCPERRATRISHYRRRLGCRAVPPSATGGPRTDRGGVGL